MSSLEAGRRAFRVVSGTARKFSELNGTFLGAGLAFYVVLYCFPLLLLFVTAFGYVLEGLTQAMAEVETLVEELFPASEQAVIETIESFAAYRGVLSLVTLGAFLLFGTFLFGAARHVLNVVFSVETRRTFLRGFGADFLAMLGTGGLLALTVGLASGLALSLEIASRLAPRSWLEPGWAILARVLTFLFAGALFYLLFRLLPAKTLSRRSLVDAALAGSILFEMSKWVFAWYVTEARDYARFYGALGGLVFFVIWIYYGSVVFVLAATFGSVLDADRG
ncbi:MAG TPA: YihY/virulence factor BrkB family protein [Vicinamibacteria bacterium]|nr:YihY/virulence factor BrkB family protein [Vicinamibacteria bacterium]